jgi:hypothetical protein
VAGGEADDFAEELLVDLAEDFGRHGGEFVGALGVVQPAEDVLEDFVVQVEVGGELVGRLAAALALEVEQAGVVLFVGAVEELDEPFVGAFAVEERLEAAVLFDAAAFAHAEEDDAVDDAADRDVELAVGERIVAKAEVLGQVFAPGFDLFEEFLVDGGGAAFLLGGFGELVERTFEGFWLGGALRYRAASGRR